jgi:hypothetical protein
MKVVLALPMALLLALSVPAFAAGGNDQGENNNDQGKGGGAKGAPGPLVGAGLPVLLIGGGIYWIVRRRNRASKICGTF